MMAHASRALRLHIFACVNDRDSRDGTGSNVPGSVGGRRDLDLRKYSNGLMCFDRFSASMVHRHKTLSVAQALGQALGNVPR